MNDSSLFPVATSTGLAADAARVLRRVQRAGRWGAWALAFALAASLVAGWSAVRARRAFDQRAVQTSALVERVCGCSAVVRFRTDRGQVVETRVHLHDAA